MVLARAFHTLVVALLLLAQGATLASAVPAPDAARRAALLEAARGHRARIRTEGRWLEFNSFRADSAGVSGVLAHESDGIGEGWTREADRVRFGWEAVEGIQVPRPRGFPVAATLGFVVGTGLILIDPEDARAQFGARRLGSAFTAGVSLAAVFSILGRALTIARADWVAFPLD